LGVRATLYALLALALLLPAGTTRADDSKDDSKKKPGLFDFEHWSTPAGHERDAVRHLVPGRFDLLPAPGRPGELRTIKLRIYADRDYRATVLSWQKHLRAQIGRINDVVGAVFAVRFEIESIREWDRSHAGMPLDPILTELAAMDPGRDVGCVIGLVTPMRGVATSVHQIGSAWLLSRHFVLRGMDDEQEILALDREFALLAPGERQAVYDQRKAHKEVVIFLHEWGHTLGLLHNEDPAIIMNPAYDAHQTAFSAYEQSVISLVLGRRFERPDEPYPEVAALESLLRDAPADEGSDKDRAQLLDLARQRARGVAGTPVAGAGAVPTGLTHEQIDRYNRAVVAANAGRTEEAWADLAPTIAELGKAAELGKLPQDATLWREAAAFAVHLGAPSAAEALMVRLDRNGPELSKLAGEIESMRHQVALPPDAQRLGVPAEREVAYVAGYREIARALSSANATAARERFQSFATNFPDAPATDVIACELDMSAKNPRKRAAAAKRCESALAKYDGAERALVLLAAMASADRRDTVAEKYLKRAIGNEPEDPGPWRMLSELYRSTHARASLTELESRHQALFSTPLPR
jgi:tetratricopeptide (TPR) repeat protein